MWCGLLHKRLLPVANKLLASKLVALSLGSNGTATSGPAASFLSIGCCCTRSQQQADRSKHVTPNYLQVYIHGEATTSRHIRQQLSHSSC
eukprot:scaffold160355_cov20-Prasinocladus_malaysianus.AAC.1